MASFDPRQTAAIHPQASIRAINSFCAGLTRGFGAESPGF
jgi:hypothetical protein